VSYLKDRSLNETEIRRDAIRLYENIDAKCESKSSNPRSVAVCTPQVAFRRVEGHYVQFLFHSPALVNGLYRASLFPIMWRFLSAPLVTTLHQRRVSFGMYTITKANFIGRLYTHNFHNFVYRGKGRYLTKCVPDVPSKSQPKLQDYMQACR
jgi:hypothetical protein